MEVTKENFSELLPEIKKCIKQSDFVGIDTEFSGLQRGNPNERGDTPEIRFEKSFKTSRGYFIMQFGLSCFIPSSFTPNGYKNSSYNFYIFPQANEAIGELDRNFMIQAHAIQFLSQHGFDFNKLFKHGISYLSYLETSDLENNMKSAGELTAKQKETIKEARGFTEVLSYIKKCKKPVVGHNLNLDLIHIFNQFVYDDEGLDYSRFKKMIVKLFPLIYDTKSIAEHILDRKSLTNQRTRLFDLYKQLQNSNDMVKISIEHQNGLGNADWSVHQAGYDAYLSGYCFIVLAKTYLKAKDSSSAKKMKIEDPITSANSIASHAMIKSQFGNKLHFAYSHTYKHFDLNV